MEEFIKNFASEWDDTDSDCFTADCDFRQFEEWSSLIGLSILHMVDKKYGIKITPDELRSANTIKELYNIVQSKK